MLTAVVSDRSSRLALPDCQSSAELELVRERARDGELLCPTCGQLLWLRAGEIRIPHFAHRVLDNCPHSGVSESVLTARSLIYRFFKGRLESGQITGEVELEPDYHDLPPKTHLDVLFKRTDFPSVAVVIVEANLRPDARAILPLAIEQNQFLFRPVFLDSRLKQTASRTYLLDTSQRAFKQKSPYGLKDENVEYAPTLRFIEPANAQWMSLRAIKLVESPQSYSAIARSSSLDDLAWNQSEGEWIHPNEQEELQNRPKLPASSRSPNPKIRSRNTHPRPKPQIEPPPKWLQGLVCVGCKCRTVDWQNAIPSDDICVCSTCFKRGVRLP